LDDWMANLFIPDPHTSGDMDWYLERKDRCIEQIWKITSELMKVGTDAILELGLIQLTNRQHLYSRIDLAGYDLTVYVLEASREIRRERVRKRNIEKGGTFAMEVSDRFFDLASNMWESPSETECTERDIRFMSTEV